MKNLKLTIIIICLSGLRVSAQDSTKTMYNEIGFNTVSLIKQLISNNPSNTLNQLPYDIFYNFYFDQQLGLRFGLGLSSVNTSSKIDGETDPRTNKQLGLTTRLGVNNNFVRQNRLTLNCFADVLYENFSTKTVNTFTSQSFPNPVISTKSTSTDILTGIGAQVGVGLKYNIYKHLSLYAEVPIGFITENTTSKVLLEQSGSAPDNSTNKSSSTTIKITIPTTVYLVLRF